MWASGRARATASPSATPRLSRGRPKLRTSPPTTRPVPSRARTALQTQSSQSLNSHHQIKLSALLPVSVAPSRASSPTLELSTDPNLAIDHLPTSPRLSPQPTIHLEPSSLTESASVPNLSDQLNDLGGERPSSLSPPPSSDHDQPSSASTSQSPARHPLIRSVTEPLDGQVQHIKELIGTTGRKAAPTRSVTAAPNGHTDPSQPLAASYELDKPLGGTLNAAQALRLVTAKAETPDLIKEGQAGGTKSCTSQAPLVLDKFSLHETRSVSTSNSLDCLKQDQSI